MHGKRKRMLALRYVIVIFWLVISFLPIYAAVTTSLIPYNNLGEPFLLPKYFRWENYVDLFRTTPYLSYLKSSLIYSLGCSILSIIVCVFAAYALSRFRFRGKTVFATAMVAVQIIPQIVIALPLYTMANKVGTYDTYYMVILAMMASAIAYPILLLKGFFDGIPVSIEEAALVDGCNRFTALLRVILPVTLPAIATAFALTFFSGWDAYLYPMILTSSEKLIPLTLGMSRMIDVASKTSWQLIMAGTVLGIIPPIIVYALAQKFLIGGLTAGSDK